MYAACTRECTYAADSCVPRKYARLGSQEGRESIPMASLDRWQGSGTQFASDRYRGWREECWHDHTSAAKTRSSQQKHWPNEIRRIHSRSKFLRNAIVRERPRRELQGCDSTRLGPMQTELRKSRHSWTHEHRKTREPTRSKLDDPVVFGLEAAIGGFLDDRVAGREIRQKPEIGPLPLPARANSRA